MFFSSPETDTIVAPGAASAESVHVDLRLPHQLPDPSSLLSLVDEHPSSNVSVAQSTFYTKYFDRCCYISWSQHKRHSKQTFQTSNFQNVNITQWKCYTTYTSQNEKNNQKNYIFEHVKHTHV